MSEREKVDDAGRAHRWCKPIASILLTIVVLISLGSLIGWLFNNPYLTAFYPGFIPLTIKSSVMLLLISAAIFSFMLGWRACFLGCVIAALAGSGLLVIDTLSSVFGGNSSFVGQSLEGTFALRFFQVPATLFSAGCLLFLSLALFFIYWYQKKRWAIWVAGVCNILAFIPILIAVSNYISGIYDRSLISLPLNGAIALVCLNGVLVLMISCLLAVSVRQGVYYRALNIFGFVFSLVLVLSVNWVEKSRGNIQDWLALDTQYITLLIKERLTDHLLSNHRFVERLSFLSSLGGDTFSADKFLEVDTAHYLKDKKGLEAIHIFDDQGKTIHFFPDPGLAKFRLAELASTKGKIPLDGSGFYMVPLSDSGAYAVVVQERWQRKEGDLIVHFVYNPGEFTDVFDILESKRHDVVQVNMKVSINGVLVYQQNPKSLSTFISFEDQFTFQHLSFFIAVFPDIRSVWALLGIVPIITFLVVGVLLSLLAAYVGYILYQLKETNSDLEAANQTKTIFLANVSHEIRTPLHGIIGSGSLLDEQLVDAKQKKILYRMMFSARYLLDLVNNLLDITKYESHTLPIFVTWCDVEQVTREQLQMLIQLAKAKNLELRFEFLSDNGSFANLADHLWKQLLMNLVGNALKFTDQGYISVQVRLSHKGANSGELHLSVADTGIGVPKDKLNLLFEKFFRIETGAIIRGGTGLGLYLTKLFVDKLGGNITVTSEEGVGTTFTVILPITFKHSQENPS